MEVFNIIQIVLLIFLGLATLYIFISQSFLQTENIS
jgi:hypothetical protein